MQQQCSGRRTGRPTWPRARRRFPPRPRRRAQSFRCRARHYGKGLTRCPATKLPLRVCHQRAPHSLRRVQPSLATETALAVFLIEHAGATLRSHVVDGRTPVAALLNPWLHCSTWVVRGLRRQSSWRYSAPRSVPSSRRRSSQRCRHPQRSWRPRSRTCACSWTCCWRRRPICGRSRSCRRRRPASHATWRRASLPVFARHFHTSPRWPVYSTCDLPHDVTSAFAAVAPMAVPLHLRQGNMCLRAEQCQLQGR